MSGDLVSYDDGGGFVHCAFCGALAAGPCARCRKPVCGDCCVLTTQSAQPWAICHGCDKAEGRSMQRGWLTVLGWVVKPIALLIGLYALLRWWAG